MQYHLQRDKQKRAAAARFAGTEACWIYKLTDLACNICAGEAATLYVQAASNAPEVATLWLQPHVHI